MKEMVLPIPMDDRSSSRSSRRLKQQDWSEIPPVEGTRSCVTEQLNLQREDQWTQARLSKRTY